MVPDPDMDMNIARFLAEMARHVTESPPDEKLEDGVLDAVFQKNGAWRRMTFSRRSTSAINLCVLKFIYPNICLLLWLK